MPLRLGIRGRLHQLRPTRRLQATGIEAYRLQDYTRARSRLNLCLRLSPDDEMARLYLARTQRDEGDLKASVATIEEALRRDPGWPPAVRHVVDIWMGQGRYAEARELLRSADPARLRERDLLKFWRVAAEVDPPTGVRIAEEIVRRDPADSGGLALIAEAEAGGVDSEASRTIANRLAAGGEPSGLAAAIRIHLKRQRLAEGLELVPPLLAADAKPADRADVARTLQRCGFIRPALELLEAAGEDREATHQRERLRGQLRVLEGHRARLDPGRVSPEPGRVLHLAHASLPHRISGYSVRMHRIAKAQHDAGMDPHVVTRVGFPPDGVDEALEIVEGVPYHRLTSEGVRHLRSDKRLELYSQELAEKASELRPAVLHPASDYENALVALSLRDALGLPVVYEVRGFWEDSWLARQPEGAERSDTYLMRRELNLQCMREADRVVTLSETMRREIVGRGVDDDRVVVIPNAIDPMEIGPVDSDAALVSRLGLGDGDVVFGYIGSVVGYEGLDDLVRAVALAAAEDDRICALIVGDGPELDGLTRLAEELGVEERFRFTGVVPHRVALTYYGLIHAFVMPRRDTRVCSLVSPLKPFEAMATRTPLIVNDLDALVEIVRDEETGLISPAEQPEELAARLLRIAAEPELRESLADAAYEWVRSERTWPRNAVAYERLYAELGAI